jgi:splicing factor 3A subunit 3
LIDKVTQQSQQLSEFYNDLSVDGVRSREIKALETNIEMGEFYARLRNIKELHRSNPNELATSIQDELFAVKERNNEQGKPLLYCLFKMSRPLVNFLYARA